MTFPISHLWYLWILTKADMKFKSLLSNDVSKCNIPSLTLQLIYLCGVYRCGDTYLQSCCEVSSQRNKPYNQIKMCMCVEYLVEWIG